MTSCVLLSACCGLCTKCPADAECAVIPSNAATRIKSAAGSQAPTVDAHQPGEPKVPLPDGWRASYPLFEGDYMLPSAAGLLGLRNRASTSEQTEYRIAVLADPVFTADDPRVALAANDDAGGLLADLPASPEGVGWADFSRLPGTLQEAEIIRELADPGNPLVLTGFAANRAQLTSGSLNGYSVLHLATHGIVNPSHPGLSGVVLSALDSDGQRQPSFVWALDLFYLQIGARLVVLSACETALGKEIRGEGLMGLTRGFFYAGTNTVISSLWQVPDRATAELMRQLYQEMLKNGRSPAAALRLAQLSIREQRRWRDPYYWAAFIVQGDWR